MVLAFAVLSRITHHSELIFSADIDTGYKYNYWNDANKIIIICTVHHKNNTIISYVTVSMKTLHVSIFYIVSHNLM